MNYNDKLQYRTYRYIERYTNLEKKCQLCGEKAEIICSDEYLKINLLCRKCKHKYKDRIDRIPKIPLESYVIKKPPMKEFEEKMKILKDNILEEVDNGLVVSEISKKYDVNYANVYKFNDLKVKIKANTKRKIQRIRNKYQDNLLQKYRIEHELSINELSIITGIPVVTIRKIENGHQNIGRVTKERLDKANIILI